MDINELKQNCSRLSLLYVEDNVDARTSTLRLLSLFFKNITVACDGLEGYECFQKQPFDIIITDINMPKMSGLEMIKEIRKTDRSIPILISSAYDDSSFFIEGIHLGVDGYLLKPITQTLFLEVLHKCINNIMVQQELDQYKNDLECKIKEQIVHLEEKQEVILRQSKFAALGEMIDAVAHQWMQPLNGISLSMQMACADFNENKVDKIYMETLNDSIHMQLDHMIETLDEFRDFLRPSKEKEHFSVVKMVENTTFLVRDELLKHNIQVIIDIEQNMQFIGIENEFKHILLNLINNAKDAFIDQGMKKGIISIYTHDGKDKEIVVEDNAGGIPEEVLPYIFNADFTTKSKTGGSGTGLYMSNKIAEKNGGTITVEPLENGSRFIVKMPADIEN